MTTSFAFVLNICNVKMRSLKLTIFFFIAFNVYKKGQPSLLSRDEDPTFFFPGSDSARKKNLIMIRP